MKIKIDSIQRYNKEISWMIGLWIGDNFSSREGTVVRNKKRSSGRFGICNNDEENISRFLEGLKNEFKTQKIKIDVHMPRHIKFDKEQVRTETIEKFGVDKENINVYYGSPWRRKIGYAVYTNNTELLREINAKIYKKLTKLIKDEKIRIHAFLQGVADSEGDVDKANKSIGICNKNKYVVEIVKISLKYMKIGFDIRKDKRDRFYFRIKDLIKFYKFIGFHTERKQNALKEMIGGNFCRQKDEKYLEIFSKYLKNGATAKEISSECKIPYPTVKMVLRNLSSNGAILKEKQKIGRTYCYNYSLSTGC